MSPPATPACKIETAAMPLVGVISPSGHSHGDASPLSPCTADSRRLSSANSFVSEGSCSVTTPASTVSQPMTPSRGQHTGADASAMDWTGYEDVKPPATVVNEAFINDELTNVFNVTHLRPADSTPTGDSHLNMHFKVEPSFEHNWAYTPHAPMEYNAHPGLKTTLFPPMYSIGITPLSASPFDVATTAALYGSVPGSSTVVSQSPHHTMYNGNHQGAQVIVPSQLGGVDSQYAEHHLPTASAPDMSHCTPDDGFGLSISTLSGWDEPTPSSPLEAYPGLVKHKRQWAPASYSSSPIGSSNSTMPSNLAALPSRPRRRAAAAKRNRQSKVGEVWAEHEAFVIAAGSGPPLPRPHQPHLHPPPQARQRCKVQLAGARFSFDVNADGRVRAVAAPGNPSREAEKPWACGRCTARFKRREHLGRHASSHLSPAERPFHCPLPGCGHRMSRSDNTGDHFKTHLRPPKGGKRNPTCSFAVMEAHLRDSYRHDVKTMGKLLANLYKWRDAGSV